MALKYLLVGAIILSVFATGILGVSVAFAKTLKLTSIFVNNQTGGNVTTFNGTSQTFEGTDEELASIYFKMLEGYEKRLHFAKPGEPVTFVFGNNTNVTVPYSGTYKISESAALLKDALNGSASYSDEICWISSEYFEQHWLCSETPW
jgi:hypothetical protein